MADETTSGSAPVAPPERPVQPASSTPQPAATSPKQTESPAPPTTTGQQAQLDAEERIKRLLRQNDQTVRQRDMTINQLRSELQQMKQQVVNVRAQGMDETEAEIFRRDQYIQDLQNELQQRNQMAAQYESEMRINNEILVMADETGVPFAELKDMYYQGAQPQDLWKYAVRNTKERLTKAQREEGQRAAQQLAAVQEKQEEEAAIAKEKPVDLGSGNGTARPQQRRSAEDVVKAYMMNRSNK